MILSCNHISKAYGEEVILDDCSFFVNDHEKAAIVGNNGAGKSTILKIIMNELSSDSGDVIIGKDKSVGYLAQYQNLDTDNSIYEEVRSVKQNIIDMENKLREYESLMANGCDNYDDIVNSYTNLHHQFELLNGYAYKSEVDGTLRGLGFEDSDFNKKISTLSGGQKTRVALCKLLIQKPDIILLDEPTNHLDLNSIKWLETYLSNYNGAVVIVAHDRYFLDKIVTKIVEIENTHCHVYDGNYSAYAVKKKELREAAIKLYIKQQAEIKHQEEVIAKLRSYKQEKFYKRAESREKALSKMEVIDNPDTYENAMTLRLEPNCTSGNDVLSVSNLAKSFDNKSLFSDISFEIKRGERVALIGDNGTGKTTILKIINGLIAADSGSFTLGTNVNIGYYDQEHHVLDPDKTLFQEIQDAYPDLNNTQIRNTLAAFLFTDDDVFKYIRDLSGGERGRVSLAKLMLSNANLLILDEPTNHLDIVSKEILENALNSYTGTVLYVSHDRYFINATATRIIELTNKNIVNYIGNYDYYLEKRDILTTKTFPATTGSSSADTTVKDSKISWQQSREEQNRLKKRKNEIKRTEERISVVEERLAAIDAEYSDPSIGSNTARLMELHTESAGLQKELDELYEHWDSLMEEE